ncbi:uncharacterized protein LOC143463301 isoform X2 [Clavelina lepadiformis]|uniref:uncharacterized protein LOC143463301 isoform X2 n=1 Tax=Clavelina lepadiformis TaxID=159417 RepID=UPI004041F3B3
MFQHRKHERQQDILNCGLLALKEAQRILNESSCEKQIDFDTDSKSCKKHRMDFGNLLLDSTDYDVLLSFCNIYATIKAHLKLTSKRQNGLILQHDHDDLYRRFFA